MQATKPESSWLNKVSTRFALQLKLGVGSMPTTFELCSFRRLSRYRIGVLLLVVGVFVISQACSSKPDGLDVRPITSLRLATNADFLTRVQKQLGGGAADYSKNGVGYLVYRVPDNGPNAAIFRNIDVYREDSVLKAQEIYARNRRDFTTPGAGQNWKLYREESTATGKWFIGYQGGHFDTNHGMPVRWDMDPDVYIGVLKQNVYVEVSFTAYTGSSDYIQTMNKDICFAADLISKASSAN